MVLTDDLNISYKIHMASINMHHWVAARIQHLFHSLNTVSLHNNSIYFSRDTHGLFQFEGLESSLFETGKT